MALFRNLVSDLIDNERIRTTEAKAKEVRKLAERIITKAKGGTLTDRRQALAFVRDESVVRKAFDELASRFAQRAGGYTRLTKLGPRKGDAAHMTMLELVP